MPISRRVHYSLHRLKFHKSALPVRLRTTFVVSLIFPLLDYCWLVYKNLTNERNVKLERLINCGIRFIFDLRQDEHFTPHRRRLDWRTVQLRRLYFLGIMTYKILHGKAPNYLPILFERSIPNRRLSARTTPNVSTLPRTSTYRNCIFLSAIYFWHSFPILVVSVEGLGTLRVRLHRVYMNICSSLRVSPPRSCWGLIYCWALIDRVNSSLAALPPCRLWSLLSYYCDATCVTVIWKLYMNIELLMIRSPVNRLLYFIISRHCCPLNLFYFIDMILVCLQLCIFYVIAYCFQKYVSSRDI